MPSQVKFCTFEYKKCNLNSCCRMKLKNRNAKITARPLRPYSNFCYRRGLPKVLFYLHNTLLAQVVGLVLTLKYLKVSKLCPQLGIAEFTKTFGETHLYICTTFRVEHQQLEAGAIAFSILVVDCLSAHRFVHTTEVSETPCCGTEFS